MNTQNLKDLLKDKPSLSINSLKSSLKEKEKYGCDNCLCKNCIGTKDQHFGNYPWSCTPNSNIKWTPNIERCNKCQAEISMLKQALEVIENERKEILEKIKVIERLDLEKLRKECEDEYGVTNAVVYGFYLWLKELKQQLNEENKK